MKLLEIIGQWFQNITYTFNVIKELCCEPCVISWRLDFWPHNSVFRRKWKYYIPYCKSICSFGNCFELPSALKGFWGNYYKTLGGCRAQPLQGLCWTDAFPKAEGSPHDKDAMAKLSSQAGGACGHRAPGHQVSAALVPAAGPTVLTGTGLEGKRHRRRHLYISARLTRADSFLYSAVLQAFLNKMK